MVRETQPYTNQLPHGQIATIMINGNTSELHVFYTHSIITTATALGYLQQQAISRQQVLFVLGRGQRPVPGFESISERALAKQTHSHALHQLPAAMSKAQSWIGYVPHCDIPYCQWLIEDSRCSGFLLIEEGALSYAPPCTQYDADQSTLASLKLLLRNPIAWRRARRDNKWRANIMPAHHPKLLGTIATSADAFPGFPMTRTVKPVWPYPEEISGTLRDELKYIIVLDGVASHCHCRGDAWLGGFFKAIEFAARKAEPGQAIHYKRHPDNCDLALPDNLFGHRLVELTSETCLEAIAEELKPTFLVNVSSIAIYASRAKAPVFTYAYEIAKRDPSYAPFLTHLTSPLKESLGSPIDI